MSDWETRMSERAQRRARLLALEASVALPLEERRDMYIPPEPPPTVMRAVLPDGESDEHPRTWCTNCGLADPPDRADPYDEIPPCPNCLSLWRWFGRVSDLTGEASGPPPRPDGCDVCWEWRRFGKYQAHFGWGWWIICGHCSHDHHKGEVWIA